MKTEKQYIRIGWKSYYIGWFFLAGQLLSIYVFNANNSIVTAFFIPAMVCFALALISFLGYALPASKREQKNKNK